MNRINNVLLVIPRYTTYGQSNHYVMPLGILYVSSYLKKANIANVITLNLNHEEGSEEDILKSYFEKFEIGLVGVGGISGEFCDLYRIASLTKKIDSNIKVVLGGGIVTADPKTTMKAFPGVDYGIIGEGEKTMVDLVSSLMAELPLDSIEGLIFKEGDKQIVTANRKEISELDTLPMPDYVGFKYDQYLKENPDLSDEGKKYSQVSVIGGRSCKYNCTFCFHPSGSTYRQRSLDSIFSEIDYLVSNYDISYIALREELFATDNIRVKEFCKRAESYHFDWSIQLRIDNVNKELVELLKDTRCRYVFVGVESASNEVLRSMRKGITLEQIEEALTLLKEAGLNSRSGVIFGDSVETWETAMFSLNWFKENYNRFRMFVDMIIAFPGSTLYKRACQSGVIPDPVQFLKDGCPIVNLTQMNHIKFKELVGLIEKMNYRNYLIRKYN